MKPFEIIQTKDATEIHVCGETLERLFINAAMGVSVALVGEGQQNLGSEDKFEHHIAIRSVDEETLLVDWLSKLLEISLIENVVFEQAVILSMTDHSINANIKGSYIGSFENELGDLVIDDIAIHKNDDGFSTTLIFE